MGQDKQQTLRSRMSTDADPRNEIVGHLPALRAFAMSLTRNSATADDLVQDTIVKAWGNFEKFREGTNLRAWLFTILRNTFYSGRRRSGREVSDPDGLLTDMLSEKPAHDGKLFMSDFLKAYAMLPDEQREALALVGAAGFSYEEAAQMCGVAVGTVKSRTNRARTRLSAVLGLNEEDGIELTDAATRAVVGNAFPRGF